MVRVKGPAMSMDASGALAGALVFSKWKGRNYIRSLVKPSNPKSGGQVGVRSAFKFLSQEWAGISAGDQTTWEDLADALVASPFNAYMKNNLLRNRNFLAPSQAYPAALALTVDAIDTFSATAGERQITIMLDDLWVEQANWGFLLFRDLTTAFTPAFDNLIAIVPAAGAVATYYVDTPLVPDEYFYDAKPFTTDAVLGTLKGEISATVL